MKLSDQAVTRFQKLYKKKCGIDLTYEEASNKALTELQKFALIYQPVPKQDEDYFNKITNNK